MNNYHEKIIFLYQSKSSTTGTHCLHAVAEAVFPFHLLGTVYSNRVYGVRVFYQ